MFKRGDVSIEGIQRIRFSLLRTELIITWKKFVRLCSNIEGYIYELAELFVSLFLRRLFSLNDLTCGEVGTDFSKFPYVFSLNYFCSPKKKGNERETLSKYFESQIEDQRRCYKALENMITVFHAVEEIFESIY